MVKQKTTTVDERNPAPLHNIYLVYSIIYRDLYILGGCLASPPRLGRNMLHMALMRHRLTPCFEWGWLCHWGRLVLKISQKRKGRFGEKYCREILLIWLQFVFFFFFLGGGKSFIQTSHNRGPDIVRAILSLQDLCHDPRWLLRSFCCCCPFLSWLGCLGDSKKRPTRSVHIL